MKRLFYPALLLLCTSTNAQSYSSEGVRKKCFVLNRFLQQQHYQPLFWGDTTVALFFDQWVEQLDEDRLYFTAQDIAQLQTAKSRLVDEMNGKSWGFFDMSLQLYRKRLLQADSLIRSSLGKPIAFAKPDKLQWPFSSFSNDYTDWAARWQRILKWKVLDKIGDWSSDSLGRLPLQQPANFAALEKSAREKLLKQHAMMTEGIGLNKASFAENFEDDYLNTIAACYDPHTAYMSMRDKKEFETSLSGFAYSTGLEVKRNGDDEWEIEHLVPGGTAWRTGELHAGDVLLKIKVANMPEEDMAEMSSEMVEALLQGNSDAGLVLTVRQKSGAQKKINLLKEKVEADEGVVKGYLLEKNGKKTGYILLPDFYTQADEDDEGLNGCANDVAKEVLKLKQEGISGLILDLRNNGGGSIWEAIQLAGIFLSEGVMASLQHRGEKPVFLKDPNRGTIYDGPLLVLINGGSASASELVSAVLQDYKRAIVVGGNSYGKGTAQVIMPMDTLMAVNKGNLPADMEDFVKVTNGKFYRVDGNTTQWKGVVPDIALPDVYSAGKFKEKSKPTALMPDMARKAFFTPLNNNFPLQQLGAKSSARVKSDSSFTAVQKMSDWLNQRTISTEIPLQWPGYAAVANTNNKMYAIWQTDKTLRQPLFQVANTRFEKERIQRQDAANKSANKMRMDKIAADIFLNECVQIILDWVN